MAVSAAEVKILRDRTNAPFGDCKAALTEANGDIEKAIDVLRKKNASIQAKRGDKETAEGRIAAAVDQAARVGAILDMRCESAPVGKADQFIALANAIVKQVVAGKPANVDELLGQKMSNGKTVNEAVAEVVGLIRENMKPARFTRLEGLCGSYEHHDGSVGVLIQVEGASADPQLLRDICMHIAARNPMAAFKEQLAPEVVARETEIAREQIANDPKNASKPANILEKIIEGKLKTFYQENVLIEQPFVKDDSKTIGQVLAGAGLKLVKFVRYKVGESS